MIHEILPQNSFFKIITIATNTFDYFNSTLRKISTLFKLRQTKAKNNFLYSHTHAHIGSYIIISGERGHQWGAKFAPIPPSIPRQPISCRSFPIDGKGVERLPLASRAKFVQADNARVPIPRPVPKLSLRDRVSRFEEEEEEV